MSKQIKVKRKIRKKKKVTFNRLTDTFENTGPVSWSVDKIVSKKKKKKKKGHCIKDTFFNKIKVCLLETPLKPLSRTTEAVSRHTHKPSK